MVNVGISVFDQCVGAAMSDAGTSVYRVCGVLCLKQVHNISYFGVRLYHDQITLRFEARVGNGRPPGQNKLHVNNNKKDRKREDPEKVPGVPGEHIIGKISIPALGGAMLYHQTPSI